MKITTFKTINSESNDETNKPTTQNPMTKINKPTTQNPMTKINKPTTQNPMTKTTNQFLK
jgi:hypothetical protein